MNVLIFGGTYEGRILCATLDRHSIKATVCVATDAGAAPLRTLSHIDVHTKRLDIDGMIEFIKGRFEIVIDATHPYAAVVTPNIVKACECAGARYIRLLRKEDSFTGLTHVDDIKGAVGYLAGTDGNILVTTGSKELKEFTELPDYQSRIYARVLPMADVIKGCEALGFGSKNIIAMQGPFSYEMNAAMLKQFNCKHMVTKNTGDAGGVHEKIDAATDMGVNVVMVDRPIKEVGHSLEEVLCILGVVPNKTETVNQHDFFPLFINSNNKRALLVGGGKINERRLNTLLMFSFDVTVISPEITDGIRANLDKITWIQDSYDVHYLVDISPLLVSVATNSRDVNKKAGADAKAGGIYISVADNKDESTFFFPAIVADGDIVAGLTSGGADTKGLKKLAAEIRGAICAYS